MLKQKYLAVAQQKEKENTRKKKKQDLKQRPCQKRVFK